MTFRLKCEPSITMTAPASLVHDIDDDLKGWGISFWNEYGALHTIVMLAREWEKES